MNIRVYHQKVFEESQTALKSYSQYMQEFLTKVRKDISQTERNLCETENKMEEKLLHYKKLQLASAGAAAAGIYTTMVFVVGIGTISLALLIEKEKKLHALLEELKRYKIHFDAEKNNLLRKIESYEEFLTKDITNMTLSLKHFEGCINDYLAIKNGNIRG